MSWIWLLVFVVVVLVVLATLKSVGGGKTGGIGFPYQRGGPLFSAAERSFLGSLDHAVGPEHRDFGKVRVADIAAVKPGLGKSARQGALNPIAAKHFDFVVCRADDLSVVCAVELNDKLHASPKTQARDELLANVCRVNGLPLMIAPAKAVYSPGEMRGQFLVAVNPHPADVGHRGVE